MAGRKRAPWMRGRMVPQSAILRRTWTKSSAKVGGWLSNFGLQGNAGSDIPRVSVAQHLMRDGPFVRDGRPEAQDANASKRRRRLRPTQIE
jgi:hypothetical protein